MGSAHNLLAASAHQHKSAGSPSQLRAHYDYDRHMTNADDYMRFKQYNEQDQQEAYFINTPNEPQTL